MEWMIWDELSRWEAFNKLFVKVNILKSKEETKKKSNFISFPTQNKCNEWCLISTKYVLYMLFTKKWRQCPFAKGNWPCFRHYMYIYCIRKKFCESNAALTSLSCSLRIKMLKIWHFPRHIRMYMKAKTFFLFAPRVKFQASQLVGRQPCEKRPSCSGVVIVVGSQRPSLKILHLRKDFTHRTLIWRKYIFSNLNMYENL